MATLEDLGELVTTELRGRVERLFTTIEEGTYDFKEVSFLADGVGELADKISEIYSELDGVLANGLQHGIGDDEGASGEKRGQGSSGTARRQSGQRQRNSEQSGSAPDDLTKEELVERARAVKVEGRSSMSKEELTQAIEAEEALTKEQLLEQAQSADIEGRSSMTKEELREAINEVRR
jgi:hypothetical protein